MSLWYNLVYYFTVAPKLAAIQSWFPNAEITPNGSRVVCDPPVLTTDVDFHIYSEYCLAAGLIAKGFKKSDDDSYPFMGMDRCGEDFTCWRKGKINIVVTSSRDRQERHILATIFCKENNVKEKSYRIGIYELFRNFDCGHTWLSDGFPYPDLVKKLTGPYRAAMYSAYKAQKLG